MKKVLSSIIIMTLIIASVNAYTFSSFRYGNTPFLNDNTLVISNDDNLSTTDYIDLVNSSSAQYDVYPVFQEINIDKSTTNNIVYYTNYQGSLPSNYPSVFSTSETVPFEKIDKFDLSTIQVALFGNKDSFKQYTDNLESNGLGITRTEYKPETFYKRENQQSLIIMFIFNLVFMYIYVLTMKKKYAILKLEGYRSKDAARIELRQFRFVSIGFLVLIFLCALILSIIYEIGFSIYFLKSEMVVVAAFLLFIIMSILIVDEEFKKTDIYSMKNNIVNPAQPIVLIVISLLITYVLTNSSIELADNIKGYQDTSAKYEQISKRFEYSTVPQFTNINDLNLTEDVQAVTDAFFNFYFLTQNDLDGTLAEYTTYGEPEVNVFNINPNYLKKQVILDLNDKPITAEDAPHGLTNLIPQSKVANNPLTNTDNVIVIKDDQPLSYLDNYSGELKTTTDYTAVTLVNYNNIDQFTSSVEKDMADNAIIPAMSLGNYYIKTSRDDPNGVSEPYIKAANAENYIRQTPLIGNDMLRTLILIKSRLKAYTIMFVATLIMEVIIIISANKALILTSRKKLSIYYLNTSKKPKLYTTIIVLNFLLFVSIGVGLWLTKNSIYGLITIVGVCLLYVVSIKVLYYQNIIKNISNNIKGDV